MFICIYDTIDSTNAYAKSIISNYKGVLNQFAIFSYHQTAGYGKLHRPWISSNGNLHLSLTVEYFAYLKYLSQIGMMSLLAGITLYEVLLAYGVSQDSLLLKWPNDVLYKNCKLAGILIELEKSYQDIDYMVVGIGLNVLYAPLITAYQTVSLAEIVSKDYDSLLIAVSIVEVFNNYLTKMANNQLNAEAIIQKWLTLAYGYRQRIQLTMHKTVYEGIFIGLSKDGYLKMLLDNNEIKHFSIGELIAS